MGDSYRITIRTDQETADAFRELADHEELTLGAMLASLVQSGLSKSDREAMCANLLAMKYVQ